RGGVWMRSDGTPLATPVISDETGPTETILRPEEYGASNWLGNMLYKENTLHFYYVRGIDGQSRYVRWNLTSGSRDMDIVGFKGETLELAGTHGFCASNVRVPSSPILCVSNGGGLSFDQLIVLRSDDNGTTWHDHAISGHLKSPTNPEANYVIYGVTGARELT